MLNPIMVRHHLSNGVCITPRSGHREASSVVELSMVVDLLIRGATEVIVHRQKPRLVRGTERSHYNQLGLVRNHEKVVDRMPSRAERSDITPGLTGRIGIAGKLQDIPATILSERALGTTACGRIGREILVG